MSHQLVRHSSRAEDLDGDTHVVGDALVPKLLGHLGDEPLEGLFRHGCFGLVRNAATGLDERRDVLEPGLGGQHGGGGKEDAELGGHYHTRP